MAPTDTHDQQRKGILLEVGTNEVEFLEVLVGEQRFGVNVAKVTQILVWSGVHVTSLPTSDDKFLGTILFRNRCIPVFDLKAMLELSGERAPVDKQLLVVMEFNQRTSAYLVDGVYNIERVSWDGFVPMGANDLVRTDSSITGTVTIDNRIVMILDMEAIAAAVDPTMNIGHFASQVKAQKDVNRSELKIVYCEDSPTIRRVTLDVLVKAGYTQILSFPTGADGLRFLKSDSGKDVDLILSDIEMPELDGLALCKSVKNDQNLAKIPFIFFSSLINDQMREKCKGMRGDACFSKPEVHLVADAIDELCHVSKTPPAV